MHYRRVFIAEGHLIDSGILSLMLNTILEIGADYTIQRFDVGRTPDKMSRVEMVISSESEGDLQRVADKLTDLGAYEPTMANAELQTAVKDCYAPPGFYSTTNHRTEVFYQDKWCEVTHQRMDAALVWDRIARCFHCVKLRDIKEGDAVVCGSDAVRVFPPAVEARSEGFSFMANEVSSERSDSIAVERVAQELQSIREAGGKVVVVGGPVVVHTGGSGALAALIRAGYITGFLGNNAIAVHDLEQQFFGTSLGVDMHTGKVVEHGHNHHMRAINTIYGYGSIQQAIDAGALTDGLMHTIVTSGIPYCLAGSIRDDGPLPETVSDMIKAQAAYAKIIEGAEMIMMLSTMLHSIGTGNMTPSYVKTVCIDINPAVVTKLSDRGSAQAVGIVSDVGLFLRALAQELRLSF